MKPRSFKSSEHINEKRDGPYRGFGYLSLFGEYTFFLFFIQNKDYGYL